MSLAYTPGQPGLQTPSRLAALPRRVTWDQEDGGQHRVQRCRERHAVAGACEVDAASQLEASKATHHHPCAYCQQ
jgi:hypothetical protein